MAIALLAAEQMTQVLNLEVRIKGRERTEAIRNCVFPKRLRNK